MATHAEFLDALFRLKAANRTASGLLRRLEVDGVLPEDAIDAREEARTACALAKEVGDIFYGHIFRPDDLPETTESEREHLVADVTEALDNWVTAEIFVDEPVGLLDLGVDGVLEMDVYAVLAAALRALRIKRGVKMEDLARHLGVTRGTVSHIESGRVKADFRRAARWAEFCHASLEARIVPRGYQPPVDTTPRREADPMLRDLAELLPRLPEPLVDTLKSNIEGWKQRY